VVIRPQDWIPGVLGLPVMDILAGTTMGFLIFEWMGVKNVSYLKVPQNYLIFGFYVAILMSHISHTYFEGLTTSWNAFLPTFILFFLMLNGVNSERKFKIMVWWLLLMTVVLVPQGLYQLEHGYGWGGQKITFDRGRNEYRINWIGIFNDPNDLALLFVVGAGFTMAFLFGKSKFFTRLLSLSILGSLCYGVFLTNSRGGLLALMITTYFFFIKRTNKIFWGSVLGWIASLILFAAGPSRKALFTSSEESAYNRLDLWYEGILMMKSNPLFGVGHNMFMDQLPQTAHNSFVLAGAELGLFGLFFFVALIYSSHKGLTLVQKCSSRMQTYALGLQSALVGYCAAAFFLSRTYVILPYLLFALAGSLMHITKLETPQMDLTFTKQDAIKTFRVCLLILLLIFIMVKIGL
jgi:O-antigen ligase